MKVLKSTFALSNTKVTVVYLNDEEENEYRKTLSNKGLKRKVKKTLPKLEIICDKWVHY